MKLKVPYCIERTYEGRIFEIDIVAHCDYSPEVHPPLCMNPSDPSYSDPGSPEDIDLDVIYVENCTDVTDDDLPRREWLVKGRYLPFNLYPKDKELSELLNSAVIDYSNVSDFIGD